MAYRRTENVVRRLNARHDAIVEAARRCRDGRRHGGDPDRAGRRAGRGRGRHRLPLFPRQDRSGRRAGRERAEREIEAVRRPPMPRPDRCRRWRRRSPRFGARALRNRRLAWAVIAEPVDTDTDARAPALSQGVGRRDRGADHGGDRRRPSAGAGRGACRRGAGRRAARRPDRPARARRHRRPGRARAKRCRRSRCSRCAGSAWSMPAPAALWCRRCCRRREPVSDSLLQRCDREPVGDGAERPGAAFGLAVRLVHRHLRVGRGAGADDGAAALASRRGSRAPRRRPAVSSMHLLHHVGDRDRAVRRRRSVPCTP